MYPKHPSTLTQNTYNYNSHTQYTPAQLLTACPHTHNTNPFTQHVYTRVNITHTITHTYINAQDYNFTGKERDKEKGREGLTTEAWPRVAPVADGGRGGVR